MRKPLTSDLRRQYPLHLQFGIILSLALVTLAFRADYRTSSDFHIPVVEKEFFDVDKILPTTHAQQKPPPPRPMIPVVVPDDAILDEEPPVLDFTHDIPTSPYLSPALPAIEDDADDEGPEIFEVVEQQPELIGGLASLQQMVRYPEVARRAGLEGRVFVQFIVDEQGNVVDPVVVRGLGGGLDEEALRAVSQAKFTPGKQRGQAVNVRMSIPITFRLR